MRSLPTDAVLATMLALAVAAGVRLAALGQLAAHYRNSAVPDMLGIAFGAAAGLALLAWTRREGPWGVAAMGATLAGVLTAVILRLVPRAADAGPTDTWVPWVAGAAAVLWAGGWALERATARRWPQITAALVALAFTGGGLAIANDATHVVTKGTSCKAWNVYHYYLGSKYFDKLGYTELYAATLAADDLVAPELPEGARTLQSVRTTRDMRTYQQVRRQEAVAGLDPAVDEATLRAMHRDLRGLLPQFSDETWKRVVSDLGYNPAPAWPVIGKPLAWLLDTHGTDRWILTNLDVPLFVLTLLAVLWAWGPRAAAGMVIFVALVGFNRTRLLGGFLAYDWFATLMIGMALYRRGWAASGGAVLSWAAMTRVFPGFLIFPGLVTLGIHLARRQSLDRRTTRFVVSFTAACAVWFALSHTTGRGLNTWPEWVEGIRLHSTLHAYDGRARIGLPRLAAHEPRSGDFWHAHKRIHDLETAKVLHAKVRPWQVLGLLVVLLAVVRRTPYDRALWMLALVWVAVTTSGYYASSWALLMVLGLPDEGDAGPEQSAPGVIAATGVLLVPVLYSLGGDDDAAIYLWINYWMGLVFLAVATTWLVSDVRKQDEEA